MSLHSQADVKNYSSALTNFNNYSKMQESFLNIPQNMTDAQIEGEIKAISENYLLTKKDSEVII